VFSGISFISRSIIEYEHWSTIPKELQGLLQNTISFNFQISTSLNRYKKTNFHKSISKIPFVRTLNKKKLVNEINDGAFRSASYWSILDLSESLNETVKVIEQKLRSIRDNTNSSYVELHHLSMLLQSNLREMSQSFREIDNQTKSDIDSELTKREKTHILNNADRYLSNIGLIPDLITEIESISQVLLNEEKARSRKVVFNNFFLSILIPVFVSVLLSILAIMRIL